MASGGDGSGFGGGSEVTLEWPSDPMGWFSDQAYNLILLAEDEARMLSHPRVEREHLLLAIARRGSAERLLPAGAARAIHDAIVQVNGFGDKLELRPRRSPASEQVLNRAVTAGHERGFVSPSSQHLLLALGEQELPARILAELGAPDVETLVDTEYARSPVDPKGIQRRLSWLATRGYTPPSPGPIPPIFERFTSQARAAINAGIEHERRLKDPYLEPVHLLLGVLDSKVGVAATVISNSGWETGANGLVQPRYPTRGTDRRWRSSTTTPDASSPRTCWSSPNVSTIGLSPPGVS